MFGHCSAVSESQQPGDPMPPRVAGWIVEINSEQLDFRVTMIINTTRGREINNILCELECPWTLPARPGPGSCNVDSTTNKSVRTRTPSQIPQVTWSASGGGQKSSEAQA